ncbi:hypothetical protein QCA50_010505 [Cerrena zonata]|uniref:Uncharacterized protein n=1 Tax=Cerrena zonata TaxID=2478898 RepID=A0AAW0G9I2_9APHY
MLFGAFGYTFCGKPPSDLSGSLNIILITSTICSTCPSRSTKSRQFKGWTLLQRHRLGSGQTKHKIFLSKMSKQKSLISLLDLSNAAH